MLLLFAKQLLFSHGQKFRTAKFPIMMIQRWLCILQFLWNWLYNILQENYLLIIAKFKPFVADDKYDLIVSNQFPQKKVEQNGTPQGKQKIVACGLRCKGINTLGQIHAQVKDLQVIRESCNLKNMQVMCLFYHQSVSTIILLASVRLLYTTSTEEFLE